MENKKNKFLKDIQSFKQIKLEKTEKERIWSNVLSYARRDVKAKSPIRSPYSPFVSFCRVRVLPVLILLIFLSAGTAVAARQSLPGDILYALKTQVAEPILSFTRFGGLSKASFALKLVDERIYELKKLLDKGNLTEDKFEQNIKLFEQHIKTYEQYVSIEKESEGVDETLELRISDYKDTILSSPEIMNVYDHSITPFFEAIIYFMESKEKTNTKKTIDPLEQLGTQTLVPLEIEEKEEKEESTQILDTLPLEAPQVSIEPELVPSDPVVTPGPVPVPTLGL